MRGIGFGQHASHESLAFTYSLDLDRCCFDGLLHAHQPFGQLTWNGGDDLCAAAPYPSRIRD